MSAHHGIVAAAALALLASAGCEATPGRCVLADYDEPLRGRSPDAALAELVSETGDWPELPDDGWKRRENDGQVTFTNGRSEVVFGDDALLGVKAC